MQRGRKGTDDEKVGILSLSVLCRKLKLEAKMRKDRRMSKTANRFEPTSVSFTNEIGQMVPST